MSSFLSNHIKSVMKLSKELCLVRALTKFKLFLCYYNAICLDPCNFGHC